MTKNNDTPTCAILISKCHLMLKQLPLCEREVFVEDPLRRVTNKVSGDSELAQ